MRSSPDKDIIYSIIYDNIKNNSCFSDYDIILESKKRKCTLDNYEIKNIVEKAFYPIYYRLTSISYKNVIIDIYHPEDKDPNKYDCSKFFKSIKRNPIIKIENNKKSLKKEILRFEKKIAERKEYAEKNTEIFPVRFIVSSTKIKEAGFCYKDAIISTRYKNYIEMKKQGKTPFNLKRRENVNTVDKYGNVRLPDRLFLKEGGCSEIIDIVVKRGNIKIFIKP